LNLRAIIFDLDGTLLNTLEDLALSVNAVLAGYGLEEHPVDHYRYYVGDGVDMLVKRAFPPIMTGEENINNLVCAVIDEYSRRWSDHTVPYAGIPELLDFLENQNIPMAIFSNKPHQFAVLTVEKLLPGRSFIKVLGIGAGMPRKPNPQGALQIAAMMKLQPTEIVYLGDTGTDMKTALAGEFYPAGALWGFRQADELLEGGAKFLADNPIDVAELFHIQQEV